MGTFNLTSTPISFCLLLFFLSTACISAQLMPKNPLQGIACSVVNCGQGTCKASNASLLGFECLCKSGWQKIQIGPLAFPSCIIPNCTINFQCVNGSSPPPPPLAPVLPPPLNFSDPCDHTWCGDGTCVPKGTGHTCQCYQGSENLMNNSELACFRQCSLGADCNSLGFGQSPPPPTLTNSSSSGNASSNDDHMEPTAAPPNSSRKLRALRILLLTAAIIFTWL
ncbi:EGF-like domain-containing protein [Citrus sinensis]|uniref:uncharacterized protein LOC102628765 isoform X1 n=1 Tax=Citrus sinensis TaxID=2711 RepID=UPI002194BC5D|nr:uncharacterized protein LOC102628765 isoform X1 [Citrus sinensis]KAH9666322.1 EGF-like domain-containing protein [Citrus sinensis]